MTEQSTASGAPDEADEAVISDGSVTPDDSAEESDGAASISDAGESKDADAAEPVQPALGVRGTELTEDEFAALLAVVGRLAGAEPVKDRGQGTAGPTNRARYRRRRLGLHERHGADAWQFAAGVR